MHDQFYDLLQQYIDGELEMLEAIILEEHLATCQTCRKMLNGFKLMDWDLKHQPAVDPPVELIAYRNAAIKTHLSGLKAAQTKGPAKEAFHLRKHILQHTFSFISCNPVNRSVARSTGKTFSNITRTAANLLRKRNSVFPRFNPGRA